MRLTHTKAFLALLALTILVSCRYKLKDSPNWDADYIAPLLQSSVTLEDALDDSTLVKTNPDNSITLVYRDTMIDFTLADYLTVPDTSLSLKVTLDSLQLSTDSIIQRMTLGELSRQAGFGALLGGFSPGPTPAFLTIPGIQGLSSDSLDIDASNFFQEATLVGGYMDITFDNQLPTDLRNVVFTLKNQGLYGNSDTVLKATIAHIPKFAKKDTSIFMGGKVIESLMSGQLINLDTDSLPGGTFVDTLNQYIELKIKLRDLGAASATAVFPEQDVINSISRGEYFFGNGIKIKRMGIRTGRLQIKAVHTIQDTIEFIYTIPSASKQGQIVSVTTRLDPAPGPGIPTFSDSIFSLDGFSIDLTIKGDSINKFDQKIVARLKYSGNLVHMDLTDSISVFYGLLDIIPEYVEGYLGQSTFSFNEGIKFDFFNSVIGGTLDLKNPKVTLTFENSIGVDGELIINNMEAINSRDNTSTVLTGSAINGPIFIPGPRLPNVGQTLSKRIELNPANSNIKDFINTLPDSISFDIQVEANKYGNEALLDNFATGDSRIAAIMDLELPLHGMADNIILQSTMDMDLSEANIADDILGGGLNLVVENYFPFEVAVQMYFRNSAGNVIDSLFHAGEDNVIQPGIVNPMGIVDDPTIVTLSTKYDRFRLEKLTNGTKTADVRFTLSTKPNNQDVKIYSTYEIKFKLIGDFTYNIGG